MVPSDAAITDRQFLRSMIPHRGGAVLMCDNNHPQSSDLQPLCQRIRASQEAEIDFMEARLD